STRRRNDEQCRARREPGCHRRDGAPTRTAEHPRLVEDDQGRAPARGRSSMNTAPIAVAFVGALALFGLWSVAMTRDRWWDVVEPQRARLRAVAHRARVAVMRQLASAGRAGATDGSWRVGDPRRALTRPFD